MVFRGAVWYDMVKCRGMSFTVAKPLMLPSIPVTRKMGPVFLNAKKYFWEFNYFFFENWHFSNVKNRQFSGVINQP